VNSQKKQQPLKFSPRADILGKLRALHNEITIARATTATTHELAALEIGDVMKDGSIFAGISPDTGKQMFAMPTDAGITMTFNDAAKYAKKLNSDKTLGHDDWRVPTQAELNVLFQNREKGALKGTFNVTGSFSSGWYWSGTPLTSNYAYCQHFSDGLQNHLYFRLHDSCVRCVR
jgi:hypothetical protein